MTGWTSFAEQTPPESHRVLVTNNLHARDSHGQMSHIWIGWPQQSSGPTESFPDKPEKGSWIAFQDDHSLVRYLTHWMPLPAAPPAQALAGEGRE